MLCRNEIAEKEAERAMIALATERYLAGGNVVHVGEPCKMTDAGLKHQHTFVINAPDKPKKEPKAKARPPRERKPVKQRPEAIKKSVDGRKETFRRKREIMAVAVAAAAALGDGLTKIAADMGVTRHLIRRIAKENNIKFIDGRKAH